MLLVRVAVLTILTVALSDPAIAQSTTKADKGIGSQPWLVVKGNLQDFTGKSDQRVAGFATEADAVKEAQRLNEVEKEWTKWTYIARPSAKEDSESGTSERPSGPKGSTITQPKLKSADPGAMKTDPKAAPSVAGRTGTGTIGNFKVTIQFNGDGNSGEFVVTGGMAGKGTWRQLGKFLLMETGVSKFDGTIDSDKLKGIRRVKEGGEKAEWQVTLRKLADPKVDGGNKFADSQFVGTFSTPNASGITTHTFRSDGTVTIDFGGGSIGQYTWKFIPDSPDGGGLVTYYRDGQRWGNYTVRKQGDDWYFSTNVGVKLKKLTPVS